VYRTRQTRTKILRPASHFFYRHADGLGAILWGFDPIRYGLSGVGHLEYISMPYPAFFPAQNVMSPLVSSHSSTASGLLLGGETPL
jgi:hypothetical protein